MGSWYDNLKKLRKPSYITIRPRKDCLEVTFQYNGKGITSKIIKIDEEVSICLKGLNVQVKKGERWGDWGGPIKCGDVLYITKEGPKLKDNRPEKVDFS